MIKNILLSVVLAFGAVSQASADPWHFDTRDHVCVETRWDYRYSREYCSEYQARYPIAPAPVYRPYHRPYYQPARPGLEIYYYNGNTGIYWRNDGRRWNDHRGNRWNHGRCYNRHHC